MAFKTATVHKVTLVQEATLQTSDPEEALKIAKERFAKYEGECAWTTTKSVIILDVPGA
jgi:hypothetical protein